MDDYLEPDSSDGMEDGESFNSQYIPGDGPSYDYTSEFGRLYLAGQDFELMVPSDNIETKRQNLQHYLFKILFGGNSFFAPVQSPERILDIGTGTGKWLQDVAEIFPDAKIVGTDIHPHVKDEKFTDNVVIVSEDSANGDWGDHPFSFIHARLLAGCFLDYRKQIIQRSFEYLEPGGWMESQEMYPTLYCDDDTLKSDNSFLEWSKRVDEAYMAVGRPIRIGNKLADWYRSVGFVDVHEEVYKLPLNGWPKDPKFKMLGRFNGLSIREGLSSFSFRPFSQVFGWTHEETEIYLTGVKKALTDRKVHYYYNVYVVWGRKPENAKVTTLP